MLISTAISTPLPHQAKYNLSCCHNNEGEEGGKVDQYEDRGGVFHDIEGRRDGGEYQEWKNHKDEEVSGGLMPEM